MAYAYSPFRQPAATLALICLLAPLVLSARADEGRPGFWSLELENDLWGSEDDRFYTGGWQFSYSSPDPPPAYLDRISELVPFYNKGVTGYYGFNIGQKIYTPENTETSSLLEDDRPYAGWLFVESFIGHRYDDRGDREKINGLILTLGIVGPAALGEDTQRLIHLATGDDDPEGWDNQLGNELGLNATYLHKWRYIFGFDQPRQYEAGLHTGLTIGNVYSYASAGFMLRWGTHLKDDIGPPTISPGFPGLPAFNPDRQANWYLFAGFEVRAVARDIFLDGNTNVDSPSVDRDPLVGDFQFGAAVRFRDTRIAFSQMIRSREFEGQPENTRIGLINFTLFVE
ncbi:MAG: lipid A deacylase LpxR family protein [Gammaproteobacteria bacterium]|jgi:hypothetical protein